MLIAGFELPTQILKSYSIVILLLLLQAPCTQSKIYWKVNTILGKCQIIIQLIKSNGHVYFSSYIHVIILCQRKISEEIITWNIWQHCSTSQILYNLWSYYDRHIAIYHKCFLNVFTVIVDLCQTIIQMGMFAFIS